MNKIKRFGDFIVESGTRHDPGVIMPYYEAAVRAEEKEIITHLSDIDYVEDEKFEHPPMGYGPILASFTFEFPKDKCSVMVYYDNDSETIAMQQDYKKDKTQVAPDVDDISLDGFKKYLGIK